MESRTVGGTTALTVLTGAPGVVKLGSPVWALNMPKEGRAGVPLPPGGSPKRVTLMDDPTSIVTLPPGSTVAGVDEARSGDSDWTTRGWPSAPIMMRAGGGGGVGVTRLTEEMVPEGDPVAAGT